jgi:hypothetical protein
MHAAQGFARILKKLLYVGPHQFFQPRGADVRGAVGLDSPAPSRLARIGLADVV